MGREKTERSPDRSGKRGGHSALFALCTVVGLALIEPALGHLERLGDTLEAKQYLLIMPAGEISYLFPSTRDLSVPMLGRLGCLLVLAGMVPAVRRFRRKGLDALSATGWALIAAGSAIVSLEYVADAEWVLFRRIGVRYLAFAMLAVGSFLGCRDRRYLSALGTGGFTWDLSSAIFWAAIKKDVTASVPVPWYHHFDQEEGRGAPCWLVAIADACAIIYFSWVARTDYDPFRVLDRDGGGGRAE